MENLQRLQNNRHDRWNARKKTTDCTTGKLTVGEKNGTN